MKRAPSGSAADLCIAPDSDNVDGTGGLSPAEIATTVPNRFFGQPMQPPTLRVVPTEMTMDAHMVGGMYAPTDRVTLAGMLSYVTKEMELVTGRCADTRHLHHAGERSR